jgi:hypothetical protein
VPPDPNSPFNKASSETPPVIGSPPPLPPQPDRKSSLPHVIAVLLSVFMALFLADGVVSLLDDSLILFANIHVLTGVRGILFPFAMLMALVTYCLMGLTPMIPKRLFLPLALFNPLAGLLVIPFLIYAYGRIQQVAWAISFYQVVFGWGMLYLIHRGSNLRWPLVAQTRLKGRAFSWRNLSVFLLLNVFVLVPAVIAYCAVCASLAVDRFSDGFLALRPEGLRAQIRKYVRDDGKTIQLVPMSHIGETDFYRNLAQSFPTNSTVLMEGVTDDRNLLTNKISYKRMAAAIGASEQQKEFQPLGHVVRADLDVGEFTKGTVGFLNLAMLLHVKGLTPEALTELMKYSEVPHFEEQLLDDFLRKRNRHLLGEIQKRLQQSDHLIVPWGAAHMPEIAKGLQESGFHVSETREVMAIRFRSTARKGK